MEDSGFTMVIHCIVITAVLYVIMTKILKQSIPVATDRSILIGTIILAYMILFGHSFPPGKINSNIVK
jgi:VIT1/CCC1 family predicted Fe2+/Mn2+ transporter